MDSGYNCTCLVCADCCCGSFIARSGLDINTFEVVDFEEVQSVFEMQNNWILICVLFIYQGDGLGFKKYMKKYENNLARKFNRLNK